MIRNNKLTSYVFLEITPPAHMDKSDDANRQMFKVIHRILTDSNKGNGTVSLEITSSKLSGIRYYLRANKEISEKLKYVLNSYIPELLINNSKDYLTYPMDNDFTAIDFKQNSHFAYPLSSYDSLDINDPIGYLTSAMTNLNDGDLIIYQLILSAKDSADAKKISQKIISNGNIGHNLNMKSGVLTRYLLPNINKFLFNLTEVVADSIHGPSKIIASQSVRDQSNLHDVHSGKKPERLISSFEQQHLSVVNDNLKLPLFKSTIRVVCIGSDDNYVRFRANLLSSVITQYNTTNYQSIKPVSLKSRNIQRTIIDRSSYRKSINIFSTADVSSLYHFPNSKSAKTENLSKSLSKKLAASLPMRVNKFDVLLGTNNYHGLKTPIGLTAEERQRHLYIVGGTGSGKSTTLIYSIMQDINNGKGVAVVDPHGDLAKNIISKIPPERVKDVIYFNPDDLSYPIGVNLLEITPGLTGDDLLREKDLITESAISVMRKIFSEDDSGGHRVEYILRNTIQTALTTEGATLFTIYRLLTDRKYLRGVTSKLKDKDLKNFWTNEMGRAGDFQRVKMAAGITSKIGRFLFSASAKRILEQEKSTINFEELLNDSKILICNLSKGLIGEDTSSLFGTTILTKIQLAAMRRARDEEAERKPFYLYVDEFQNFATLNFVQMLSESRKYKLLLTMAEQSTSQQEEQRLVDVILANVGTVMCFRSSSPADERNLLPIFKPYIDKGEISNLPAYNFYVRIAAVDATEPMSGTTVLLGEYNNKNTQKNIIKLSRSQYAIRYLGSSELQTSREKIKQPTKQIKLSNIE